MASTRRTVEIVPQGMVTADPVNKFSYVQNLYKNKGSFWESRDGFGTIARFNCSVSPVPWVNNTAAIPSVIDSGYKSHLGSYLIRTKFGHDQIISVFQCNGYITGDNPKFNQDLLKASKKSDYVPFYAVSIFDVTTKNRYETILYSHTGESRKQGDYHTGRYNNDAYLHGFYETRSDTPGTFQRVILAEPSEFWFHEYQDRVIFGSKDCPTYVYDPVIIHQTTGKFLKNTLQQSEINDDISNPTGEENIITPLALKDGPLKDGYAYLQQNDLPKFVDATTIANRVVYAAGKSLFFADANIPNSIIGDEQVTLDLEDDITCIQNWNNNIIVWTDFEMQLYQPSLSSQLLSLGGAVKVSNKVGCINPKTAVAIDDGVYWADHNGVYFTKNGLGVSEISESIGLFFTDFITNPVSKFFTENGQVEDDASPSNYEYSYRNSTRLSHIIYDQKYQQLIFVVPELSIAWVLKKGWYLWNFETDAKTETKVDSQTKLDPVYLLTRDEEIFMIGAEQSNPVQQAVYNTANNLDVKHTVAQNTSFALLEWKRGGAIDGSYKANSRLEDWRQTHGYQEMNAANPTTADVKIYFEKWIPKTGRLQDATSGGVETIDIGLDDTVVLLPIRLTALDANIRNINKLQLDFVFDDDNWTPVTFSGSTNVAALLPTRRSANYEGWGIGAPAADSSVTYDAAANKVLIRYNHANVTNPNFDGIRVNHGNKNDLIYIPMRRVSNSVQTNNIPVFVSLFLLTVKNSNGTTTDFDDFRSFTYQCGVASVNMATEQAVDWVIKPNYVGIDELQQIKSRGTFTKLLTHGTGTTPVVNWEYGLINQLVGSDYKDYTTQLIDVGVGTNFIGDNATQIVNKDGVRNRIVNSAGTLTKTTFNNNIKFDSNYLVRNEEYNTFSTSDGTRGEEISYTFFGYLKNKAEKIIISSINAVVFAVGGKRRRGR